MLLKKAARCHPFLAVVRCLFHNHLRLKRSSLLNVYLNYKFEISLLTSRLFFSLFNLRDKVSLKDLQGALWSLECRKFDIESLLAALPDEGEMDCVRGFSQSYKNEQAKK